MTNYCSTSGFVFKKENKSETDRCFSIFTDEFGYLNIFAKAIRKITSKLKSGIDIFSISEIEFIQSKTKKTLTDAVFIQKFDNIIFSPKRFEIATKISVALGDFIKEQEKDRKIFDLLKECFEGLDSNSLKKEKCDLIYYYFLWNLFSILGFKPELQKCADCFLKLDPSEVYFSSNHGGTICQKCFSNNKSAKKTNQDSIKILRLILKKDLKTILKLKTSSEFKELLEDISKDYSRFLINK